MFLIC